MKFQKASIEIFTDRHVSVHTEDGREHLSFLTADAHSYPGLICIYGRRPMYLTPDEIRVLANNLINIADMASGDGITAR